VVLLVIMAPAWVANCFTISYVCLGRTAPWNAHIYLATQNLTHMRQRVLTCGPLGMLLLRACLCYTTVIFCIIGLWGWDHTPSHSATEQTLVCSPEV
jgi:hypothetical protein